MSLVCIYAEGDLSSTGGTWRPFCVSLSSLAIMRTRTFTLLVMSSCGCLNLGILNWSWFHRLF